MKYELLIIIALSILLMISTFISTKGSLTDKRKNGLRSITNVGWRLIIINFVILLLLLAQYFINEYKTQKKEIEYSKNQEKRDSVLKSKYDSSLFVIKSKFDTSNIQVIRTVTDVLGSYGYRLDMATKSLTNISNDPVLTCSSFNYHGISNGIPVYKIIFTSQDASSSAFNIMCYFIGQDSLDKLGLIKPGTLLENQDRLFKDASKFYYYKIYADSLFKIVYLRMVGTYKNSDQTKTFKIDDIYYYNRKGKTNGMVTGDTREKIIKLTEEYNSYIERNKTNR